jgi:hypothetical protein
LPTTDRSGIGRPEPLRGTRGGTDVHETSRESRRRHRRRIGTGLGDELSFHEEGASVVILEQVAKRAPRRRKAIIDKGDSAIAVVGDAGNEADVETAVQTTVEHFSEPTLVEADNGSELARTEVFGPVLAMTRYSDDQAIAIADDSEHGLAGYVYTSNLNRRTALQPK